MECIADHHCSLSEDVEEEGFNSLPQTAPPPTPTDSEEVCLYRFD